MSNKENRITPFENKAHRRLFEINYLQMKTYKYVNDTFLKLVDKFEPRSTIQRRKMSYYGYTCRHNCMAKRYYKEELKVLEYEVALKRT